MMIPSIDIQAGKTVQLIGGKELAIEAGDPKPLAEKFGRVGEIAVIDLDAAMSTGSNADLISKVLPLARCRVGGGIRDVEAAIKWLDAGAAKVILGTAARPEILSQLPKERVVVALDAVHDVETGEGVVVDQGWQNRTGDSVLERMESLSDLAGGFMVTFVEREGQMTGIDQKTIAKYLAAAGDTELTVAGGVAKEEEIAELDAIVDSKGKSHDWRADLVAQLSSVQKEDGSWTNPADRWYEGDPNLVTAYSLLALSYCDKESDAK